MKKRSNAYHVVNGKKHWNFIIACIFLLIEDIICFDDGFINIMLFPINTTLDPYFFEQNALSDILAAYGPSSFIASILYFCHRIQASIITFLSPY